MINLLYIALYLVFINIISILLSVIDKVKAKLNGWRISEKTLLITSAIGGALGMYITMKLIRHKTQHKRFMIGLPIIIFLQCVLLIYILHLIA